MSDDNVGRFVKKYADAARVICPEVPEKVTPHMFRHSRALSLYRHGMPLPLIAEWLGHSQLETSLIYAYADTEMKRAAIEKATSKHCPIRTSHSEFAYETDEQTLKRLYGLLD
jgi:integrase